MIRDFGEQLTGKSGGALGEGVTLSVLISLWSANKGTQAVFEGLNISYGEQDSRGFLKKNAITLLATLLALLTGIVAYGAHRRVPCRHRHARRA